MPSFAVLDAKRNQIAGLCRQGLPAGQLLDQLREPLGAVVPYDGLFLSATDPATTLFASSAVVEGLPETMCAPWFDNEFLVDDFNKFVDLHRTGSTSSTIGRATFDRPRRSARYREVNTPAGFGPELRAVFSIGSACWGVMSLVRETTSRDFSDEELGFVDEVSPLLAQGLRRAVTEPHDAVESPVDAPGVVLLDGNSRVISITDRVSELIGELGHPMVRTEHGTELPAEVYMVAIRAKARAEGRLGPPPVARLQTASGRWLTLRGEPTRDSSGQVAITAVVVEPSRAVELLPLLVAAHGLSPREEEVLAELLVGRPTAEIAHRLFISVHTVRDHVKSILEKVGVRSRAELISEFFRTHQLHTYDTIHHG